MAIPQSRPPGANCVGMSHRRRVLQSAAALIPFGVLSDVVWVDPAAAQPGPVAAAPSCRPVRASPVRAIRPGAVQAALTPPGAAPPRSAQDQADIARVESYLNGLKSLKAQFVQVAGTGEMSKGAAWLERPGRMRFNTHPLRHSCSSPAMGF